MTFPLKIVGLLKTKVDTTAQFKFTINTALGTGNNFQLPLPSGQTYNFIVYWGDGNFDTITAYNQAETLHSYSSGGTYQITIDGKCGGWSFNNGGDKLKVTNIDQWGNVGFDYLLSGFYGCSNLSLLPNESIKYSSSITELTSFLRGTGFSTISDLTFKELTNVTSFANCFQDSSITSIPSDLFRYNTLVTSFESTFNSCQQLVTINSDVFRYNILVTTFNSTFYFCGNTSFNSLPADLFRYNTSVTTFASTFAFCYYLNSLPTDLFRYNTAVTTFASTFSNCINISSLPNNLFYYNSAVTVYNNTFDACRNIALPSVLFNLSNLSIVTNFNYFMQTGSTSYSNTGTIQDVWNYATSATSVNAFLNQTSITNYASIPNGWKGL